MTKEELAQAILLAAKHLQETVIVNASCENRNIGDHEGSPTAIKRQCLTIRDFALKLSKEV